MIHPSFFVCIVTGRNEVLAKVIFLHLCVILFTGGVPDQARPPGTRQVHPQGTRQVHPPGTRQVHPPDQAGTPPDQVHPPDQAGTPPRKQQTPEYGQRQVDSPGITVNDPPRPLRILLECILVNYSACVKSETRANFCVCICSKQGKQLRNPEEHKQIRKLPLPGSPSAEICRKWPRYAVDY